MTKCFIMGETSSFASHLKASRKHRITQLGSEIQTLESDLKQFSKQAHAALPALKFELNNLLRAKAEFVIHQTGVIYYDQSERSSKLLAA